MSLLSHCLSCFPGLQAQSLWLLPYYGVCRNKRTPGSWSCFSAGILHPWPPGSDGHFLSSIPAATSHDGCRRRETACESTLKVPFTSLFPIWVEPCLCGSVHRLPAQGFSLPALRKGRSEASEARQLPGQNDGQWGQRPQHQVSLSSFNFLSGHVPALGAVIRQAS